MEVKEEDTYCQDWYYSTLHHPSIRNEWCDRSCWGEIDSLIFKCLVCQQLHMILPHTLPYRWKKGHCSEYGQQAYVRWWKLSIHPTSQFSCVLRRRKRSSDSIRHTYTFPSTISYSSVSAMVRPETVAVAFPLVIFAVIFCSFLLCYAWIRFLEWFSSLGIMEKANVEKLWWWLLLVIFEFADEGDLVIWGVRLAH